MKNFEKITASPEAMAAFLSALPIPTGPWDEVFHKRFCVSCGRENCDDGPCPHQENRSNPAWWLGLEEDDDENK